jgi:hypothetical protein
MSKDQKDCCTYCKFWKCTDYNVPEDLADVTFGVCRLSAPRIIQAGSLNNEAYAETRWPSCKGGDWCGEFEMRRDDHGTSNTFRPISEIAADVVGDVRKRMGKPE